MDNAGQMAADRGIVEALKFEMNIKVVTLSAGKDPADLILLDKLLFEKSILEAKPMMQYYLDKILAENDISRIEEKRKATTKIVNILAKIINRVEQDFWLKKSAIFLDVPESILKEMIEVQLHKDNKYIKSEKNSSVEFDEKEKRLIQSIREEGREIKLTKSLLAILIKFPDLISYAISDLELKEIFGEKNKEFYNQLIIYYNKNNGIEFSKFKDWLEANDFGLNNLLIELSILGEKDFYNFDQQKVKIELINIIMEIKNIYKRFLMKKMEKKISSLEAQGKLEEANKLLEELQNLMT
jgi:DNA primase